MFTILIVTNINFNRFVNVLLPPAAQAVGVQLRWWQPQHDGADHADWALDNVLVSGSDTHTQISDTFGGVALPSHERYPADGTSTGHIRTVSQDEQSSNRRGATHTFTDKHASMGLPL